MFLDGVNATQVTFEETYAYASLANRMRYDQPINDIGTVEYRNLASPLISEFIPAAIIACIAKFVGVPTAVILIKIFFPLFLVGMWYFIGTKIGLTSIASGAASLAAVFLPKLYVLIPYYKLLTYLTDPELEFQRISHPLISGAVTVMTILLVVLGLKYQSNKKVRVLAGVSLGLLFYTYIFSWTLAIGTLGLLFVSFIVERNWQRVKWIVIVFGIGLCLSLPYLYNAWQFYHSTFSVDFWARSVFVEKQNYNFIVFRGLLLILLAIVMNKSWWSSVHRRLLLCLLCAAVLLPVISQTILGINFEGDHWIIRFFYPLSAFMIIAVLGEAKKRHFPIVSNLLFGLVFVAVGVKLVCWEAAELKMPQAEFKLSKSRQDLYAWMSKNIKKDSVIGSLSLLEQTYLTSYTPYYPYVARFDRTVASTNELLNRYLYVTQVMRFKKDYFDKMMVVPLSPMPFPDIPNVDQRFYATIFGLRYYHDVSPYPIFQEVINEVKARQQEPISQNGKLDYLLVTPTDRFFSSRDLRNECQPLFDNQTYQLYKWEDCKGTI